MISRDSKPRLQDGRRRRIHCAMGTCLDINGLSSWELRTLRQRQTVLRPAKNRLKLIFMDPHHSQQHTQLQIETHFAT